MTDIKKVIELLESSLAHVIIDDRPIREALALLREKPEPAELSRGISSSGKPTVIIADKLTMDVYSPPGTRIVFAYPDAGYPSQRRFNDAMLKVGNTYTVERTEVGRTETWVYLKEVDTRPAAFNSVFFAPAVNQKEQSQC